MAKCDHCLLEVPDHQAIYDTVADSDRVFCCSGCRGVYRMINEEGLDDFYERREADWTPGPPVEEMIEPSAFDEVIKKAGDEFEMDIVLDGIRCASCIWLIEKVLIRTKGVTYAKVNYATHRAKIRWKPDIIDLMDLLLRIHSIGYMPKPFIASAHEERVRREQRDLLMRFGTASFFSMQLMLYSIALYAGYFQGIDSNTKMVFQVISLILTTPVLFYSGMPLIKGSLRGLRNLTFNMDVLIVTGSGSAYIYSMYQIPFGGEVYFDTAAMIITLILLGRYIETGAKGRASEVITRLLSLNPKEARVMRNPDDPEIDIESVPISSIKVGDHVEVRPGENIPLDGTVIKGESEVDESMLTGESRPVAKMSGKEVFCGTRNLYGSFVFSVSRIGADTVLSNIIRVVEEAQARQAPLQALADRVVGFFVPAVLLLSAVTGMGWYYSGSEVSGAIMNAVSVLVIACPCALGLATPLAILIGTGKGASKGILIKGGDIIEKMKAINTVVFDKTGTITEGKQRLVSYKGIDIEDREALQLAASLERYSEHSISRAIVHEDISLQPLPVTGFRAVPGKGVVGTVDGKTVMIGNMSFIDSYEGLEHMDKLEAPHMKAWLSEKAEGGATVVYMVYGGRPAGIFIISDTIRKEARNAVTRLQKMGQSLFMITGDGMHAALSTANEVALDRKRVIAEYSPVEKAGAIKKMQEEGRSLLMVGDGINDAPALIQADVGMAMGRATDIALESADMVIMKNDLNMVPEAIRLAKRIYSIIKQNLFWAFGYNVVALPLAVVGMLHPIVAAIAMTFSSLSVVANSVRLKRG